MYGNGLSLGRSPKVQGPYYPGLKVVTPGIRSGRKGWSASIARARSKRSLLLMD